MTLSAPQITGHRHIRLISDAGGYGDVHLYEETALGNRRVAIKVIRDQDLESAALRQFLAEANTMAALEHPNIVRVYGSGSTADGRPYISMQYCAGDTLEQRVLTERPSVAEVLRIGVGIGSAIETAHRAGLLHRDIKPANILKTPWGAPGLTDFGVAHKISSEEVGEDIGVSIPWSPPEMLYTTTNGSRASDIYSLAATMWHLLVGRPPFEAPGGDNSMLATMGRIRDLPAPPTGRAGVPESLERALRHAMAKRPEQRPQTMDEFIRNLQGIEAEQRFQVTESVVVDFGLQPDPVRDMPGHVHEGVGAVTAGLVEGTVVRPRTSGAAPSVPARGIPDDAMASARTQLRPASTGDMGRHAATTGPSTSERGTVLRPRVTTVDVPHGSDPEATGRAKGLLVGGGVALLALAATAGFLLLPGGGDATPEDTPTALSTTDAGMDEDSLPPGPVTVKASRAAGEVTFTWDYSALIDTDEYLLKLSSGAEKTAESTTLTVPVTTPEELCLAVKVVRLDGSNASREWSEPGCA